MLVCWVCGVLALVVSSVFDRPQMVMQQVVFGMAARMIIPLGTVGLIYFRGRWLMEGGMAFYLLIFYFVVLLVDTLLLLRRHGMMSKPAGVR